MDLSQEELKKINDLHNTARFQHSWKAIRNIITWKERVQHYFARNMVLLFLCFLFGGGLMLLTDEGALPRSEIYRCTYDAPRQTGHLSCGASDSQCPTL